jgi:hypothetical protein
MNFDGIGIAMSCASHDESLSASGVAHALERDRLNRP